MGLNVRCWLITAISERQNDVCFAPEGGHGFLSKLIFRQSQLNRKAITPAPRTTQVLLNCWNFIVTAKSVY
jgi:hypothetical protein